MTEIGHICIEVYGRRCSCGCQGCFETYASAAAVGRDAREALRSGGEEAESSKLWQRCGGDLEKVDAKMLCDAARDGDRFAGKLLDVSCNYIAAGTGSLINALNPGCVVLGGGLALAGEVLISRVRALLSGRRAFAPIWRECRLLPSQLGDDAGLLGAALLAFRRAEVKV
jgi:glucokinase